MNTTTVPTTTDEEIEAAAEAHRLSHAHTVTMLPGVGWVCSVCDEDHDEVVEEYLAGGCSCGPDGCGQECPDAAPAPSRPEFEILSATFLDETTILTARCVDGGIWTVVADIERNVLVKPSGAHVEVDLFVPDPGPLGDIITAITDLALNGGDLVERETVPEVVEYVVLVDLGGDVTEVVVEATDPAAARSIAAEMARNMGHPDAEAVDVELASEIS